MCTFRSQCHSKYITDHCDDMNNHDEIPGCFVSPKVNQNSPTASGDEGYVATEITEKVHDAVMDWNGTPKETSFGLKETIFIVVNDILKNGVEI